MDSRTGSSVGPRNLQPKHHLKLLSTGPQIGFSPMTKTRGKADWEGTVWWGLGYISLRRENKLSGKIVSCSEKYIDLGCPLEGTV